METEEQPPAEQPSKTQRKKEMHALQELGARLTEFSKAQLEKLPLPDKLRNAIHEFQRLPNSHGAKRRQLQYIGRLMRDFELEEIERQVDQIVRPPQERIGENNSFDTYCEQVLSDGDEAINSLLEKHHQLERQILRKHYLDFRKAMRSNNETASEAARNKLRMYLQEELS